MKLRRRRAESMEVELSAREAVVLSLVLRRYPVLDPGYHQIARTGAAPLREEQQLLEESIAAAQSENRRRVAAFLDRCQVRAGEQPEADALADRAGLVIPLAEVDWLLEVLNDVRVGLWVKLGRPAPRWLPDASGPSATRTDFAVMDLAGAFQAELLAVLPD
jgi:hypothetical protein